MANFHGVKIPTQLTLAVLNQIKAITVLNMECYPDENAHLCFTVAQVFDLNNDEDKCVEWWIDFLCDVGIGYVGAFRFGRRSTPSWWPHSSHGSWSTTVRNIRRLIFIDLLITEVLKDA